MTDGPNWDAVCFHAQQAIEKYLKALLQDQGIPFLRIHDLSILAKLLLPVYPEWETCRDSLERLSTFAVELRYPGEAAETQYWLELFEDSNTGDPEERRRLLQESGELLAIFTATGKTAKEKRK